MEALIKQRIEETAQKELEDTLEVTMSCQCANIAYEEFLQGAKYALTHQWISVEEALPDDDENVLLLLDDGNIVVAYHSGNYWWWCDGFVCGTKTNGQPMYSSSQRVDDKPTHWMNIPGQEGGEK